PYFAGIGGTSTSSYFNPNSFAIGDNSPGVEMAGITKTAVTDGYFRYSLSGLSTNTFSGPLGGGCPQTPGGPPCSPGGGRNVKFYGRMTQSFGGYGIVTGQLTALFVVYGNAPTML